MLGQYVDQVEIPVGGHAVAVVVGLGEVVAGVEEDDGHFRADFADHVHDDHVFGLEAAGDADFFLAGLGDLIVDQVHGFERAHAFPRSRGRTF